MKRTLLRRFERRFGWIATAAFLLDTPTISLLHAAVLPWDWTSASPESEGVSKARLDALRQTVAERKTTALLVIRNDNIVCEWYAPGHGTNKPHGTASMAKAIVGGLSLAIALTDDRIALDDPAARFVPQWKDDPRKARITIRQLGSHTSGLEDAEVEGLPHEQLTGWKGDFWKRLNPPDDPFTISRDRTPALFDPGEKLHYSNPGIAMLTWCVTAALRNTPHQDIRTLLRERVMRPIGVRDDEWSVGYGKTCTVEGLPLVASWGGGSYTARAVARIGRLILRQGDWDGKALLSREAVRQMVGDAGLPGNCGMGWWNNAAGRYPKLPKDAAWGAGAGDQLLLVIPSLNLILVRNGDTLAPPPADAADVMQKFHDPRMKILFEPLVDAITEKRAGENKIAPGTASRAGANQPTAEARGLAVAAALPSHSLVIQRIEWAPTNTIRRAAKGSDRFPLTWAEDYAQYTAWGDGWGFGGTSEKLSLGYARVAGAADDFGGVDVRSTSGEAFGEGSRGFKASGILFVGGVLYMWAGNANTNTGSSFSVRKAILVLFCGPHK